MAGFAFSLLAFIYYLKRRELVAFNVSLFFVSLHSCPFPSFSLEKVAIPGYSSRLPLNVNAYKLPNSTLRLLAPYYHRRPLPDSPCHRFLG